MAQQPTIVSGQNIIVPAPRAGDNVSITSSPSGNLTFEFDINAAEPSRVDNDLVLQTPEGSVTIGNFFAVGEESLPTLTLTDGVVVDATDFFDGSGVDMTTAAGPAGARADGSGTNYDDGAGALVDGVDRLGSLGNFQWGREVEFGGEDLGLLGPMGDFTFGINTEWGGTNIAGVYEDGRPNQNTGDYSTIRAGKVDLTFNVGPGTTVGNIVFSGFSDSGLDPSEQGTFFLGDPSGPAGSWTKLTQADSYSFTQGQLTSPGVYYMPGDNDSDTDINFAISVTFTGANGASVTQSQTATIIVDAVADKPEFGSASADADETGHSLVSTKDTDENEQKQGYWTSKHDKESLELEGTGGAGAVTIKVDVTGTFKDFVDGSEKHYILLEVKPNMTPTENYPTVDIDGATFYKIEAKDIDPVTGKCSQKIEFTASGYTEDTTETWVVGTYAEEAGVLDGEIDFDNNVAHTLSNEGTPDKSPSALIDVVNSNLTVRLGWASEGNNDGKHLGYRTGTPNDYRANAGGDLDLEAKSTGVWGRYTTGAPIEITIADNEGAREHIESFTLTETGSGVLGLVNAGRFTALANGMPDIVAVDGVSKYFVEVSADGSSYTFTLVSGPGVTSTDNFKESLVYRPEVTPNNPGYYDFGEVELEYVVQVKNGAGAEAKYSGSSTIVIDAVADRAVIKDEGFELEDDKHTHAKPGDSVVVKGTVGFPDSTGNEEHQFSFRALHEGTITGGKFSVTGADGTVVHYTFEVQGPAVIYWLDSDPATTLSVPEADDDGFWIIPVANDSSKVDVAFDLTLSSSTLKEGGVNLGGHTSVDGGNALVDDPTYSKEVVEYDKENNESSNIGRLTVKVDGAVNEPSIGIGSAFEDAAQYAHLGKEVDATGNIIANHYRPDADSDFWDAITAKNGWEINLGLEGDEAKQLEYLRDSSAKITLTPGKDSNGKVDEGEFISGVKISFTPNDLAASGNFMLGDALIGVGTGGFIDVTWKGETIKVNCEEVDGNVTLTILSDGSANLVDVPFYFVPGPDHHHEDVDFDIAMSATNHSNNFTQIFDNDTTDPKTGTLADELKENLIEQKIIEEGDGFFHNDTGVLKKEGDYTAEIDAVAQKTEFEVGDPQGREIFDDGGQGTGEYYKKLVPGDKVVVSLKDINFHGDFDGSQNHALLVQVVDGYTINHLVLTDTNGNTISLEGYSKSLPQPYKGDFFREFKLEDILKAYNDDPANASKPPLTMDDIKDIGVNVTTPTGGATGAIKLVVRAHEDWDEVIKNATGGDDFGETQKNNTAYTEGTAKFEYSSVTPPSADAKNWIHENNNWKGNTEQTERGYGSEITFSTGDKTDRLYDFSLEVKTGGEGGDPGDLWVFKESGDFTTYTNKVLAGEDPITVLNDMKAQGLVENCQNLVTLNDIKGSILNDEGEVDLTAGKFGGAIVFVPSTDYYSGKDPDISCVIKVVDTESGADSSFDRTVTIPLDTVAQLPGDPELKTDVGSEHIQEGESRTVKVDAKFTDLDDTTEHFILVEVLAGWDVSYTGINKEGESVTNKSLTLEDTTTILVDGEYKNYYKIPVKPTPEAEGSHTGTGSTEITVTSPTGGVYYPHDSPGSSGSYILEYNFDIKAGSIDTDISGRELIYHNNTAITGNGGRDSGLGGKVEHKHSNDWIFEQHVPLFEDNLADKHKGDYENETLGSFHLAHPGAAFAIITVPSSNGEPLIEIIGGVLNPDGTYTVFLKQGEGDISIKLSEAYLQGDGNYSDKDLSFENVDFCDGNGVVLQKVPAGSLNIIVDAVADAVTKVEVKTEERYDKDPLTGLDQDAVVANVGSGEDAVAKFIVAATFADNDGSENHYILVEKTPAWKPLGEVEEVHLGDKTYYRFNTTSLKEVSPGEYEISLVYQGGHKGAASGKEGIGQPIGTEKDGVWDYQLKVGTMTEEKATGAGEFTTDNNVSVNLDGSVELYYSPIDSKPVLDLPSAAFEGDEIPFSLGGIATDKSDVLTELTINSPAGGTLTYGSGTSWAIYDGTITDPAILKALSEGTSTLKYVPNGNSHKDIQFSWSATVKDTVSGAQKTINGSKDVIIDAVADSSVHEKPEVSYEDGYEAAKLGKSTIVSITTEFEDLENSSEIHYVVFEQLDAGYEVFSIDVTRFAKDGTPADSFSLVPNKGDWDKYMSTQFDGDGKPYWAFNGDAGSDDRYDYKVDFHVSTPSNLEKDYAEKLGVGTIIVETTQDSSKNNEPNYTNNWKENIEGVEIKTGVITTVEVKGEDQTINEDQSVNLTLSLGDKGGNTAVSNESITTLIIDELKNGSLWYDGVEYSAVDGKITLTFSPDGFDTSLLEYHPNKYWSGTETIKYTVTVTDKASGATNKEPFNGSLVVTVDPVANEAENFTVGVVNDGEGSLQLALSASLVDTDGSEELYFLVEKVPGLEADYEKFTDINTGVVYYQVVAGNEGKADMSFTTDGNFTKMPDVVAKSQDGGDYALAGPSNPIDWGYDIVDGGGATGAYDFGSNAAPVYFTGADSNETVTGSGYNDIINLGNGNNYVFGSGGSDRLIGGTDSDTLDYSTITGGAGIVAKLADGQITLGDPSAGGWTDTVSGFEEFIATNSDDIIHLGGGVATVHGGAGNDRIFGSDADETIYAGTGNDLIYGGKGNDKMFAGDGQDTFAWKLDDLGEFKDIIHGFKVGEDIIQLDPSLDALINGAISAVGTPRDPSAEGPLFKDASGNTFDIACESDSCTITLGTSDRSQTIEFENIEFSGLSGADDLALLIQTMIKVDSGN